MLVKNFIPLLTFLISLNFQFEPINACLRKAPAMSQKADAFSPVDLMRLANFESKLFDFLVEATENVHDEGGLINSYLKDYQETTVDGTMHLPDDTDEWVWATAVSSHPFLAYRFVRRILVDLPPIMALLEQQQALYYLDQIHEAKANLKWPTIVDKNDILERIIRIQTIYDIDVVEFAAGESDITGITLSAAHCVEIGRYATSIGKYASGAEWLNVAFQKTFSGGDESMSTEQVIMELTLAIEEHDKAFEHLSFRHSGNLENLWDHDLFNAPFGKLGSLPGNRLRHLPQKPDNAFKALELCRGVEFQSEKVKAKLTCWYETKKHPYTQISPMKVELLSKDPYLIRIYDFLEPQGSLKILDLAISKMDQLAKFDTSDISPNVHGARKRRHAPHILTDDSGIEGEVKALSAKLECFAGHKKDLCPIERLQVSGYTFGNADIRLEAPDQGVEIPEGTVEKITSVLVYLNHVDVAGYTVFPEIGIFVKPVKGSALFWSNLVGNDEERDTRLMHAECPVILGKKWVGKKKFHSADIF